MSESTKKKRERSPSYPAVGLEEALGRARKLYDEERRNAAPVNTILKHWGYSPGSGGGLRVLAALEKFGLTADEGSGPNRKARLTEDAYSIVIDERPDSKDRLRLIQQAALRPTVHADLWEQYKAELPSPGTLRFELRKKGFTEGAADELIEEYRATLTFAKLGEGATLTDEQTDKKSDGDTREAEEEPDRRPGQRARRREMGMTVLSFQVSDRLVEIAVDGGPLTKGELTTLKAYLDIQEKIAPTEGAPPSTPSQSSWDRYLPIDDKEGESGKDA